MADVGILQIHLNPMQISSLTAFTNINGRFQNGTKDVYFIRYIGFEDQKTYIEGIRQLDDRMRERSRGGRGGYLRLSRLEARMDPKTAETYSAAYQQWREKRDRGTEAGGEPGIPGMLFHFTDEMLERSLEEALDKALRFYRTSSPAVSDSMKRNFGIKLLYWLDAYLPVLYGKGNEGQFPKFAMSGDIKVQEYLFLYVLTCLGSDVIYLNPEKDAAFGEELMQLSSRYEEKNRGVVAIPEYREIAEVSASNGSGSSGVGGVPAGGDGNIQIDKTRFTRPPSKNRRQGQQTAAASVIPPMPSVAPSAPRAPFPPSPATAAPASPENRRQLEYEELARLSPGIVMISAYNKQKECFKTGSGVVVSEKGYILTNFHVACEAAYYGIRFEEEEQIYGTDELIKYNQFHDLAIIRIDRHCSPIRVYQGGKELVRGQKVVAIGSPLGLFNSVSDGIISGFRVINDVSMIQFTAPISHGSSGGALLNLYGELVGIITAGFDDGQNINLAVDYKTVMAFARGFL